VDHEAVGVDVGESVEDLLGDLDGLFHVGVFQGGVFLGVFGFELAELFVPVGEVVFKGLVAEFGLDVESDRFDVLEGDLLLSGGVWVGVWVGIGVGFAVLEQDIR